MQSCELVSLQQDAAAQSPRAGGPHALHALLLGPARHAAGAAAGVAPAGQQAPTQPKHLIPRRALHLVGRSRCAVADMVLCTFGTVMYLLSGTSTRRRLCSAACTSSISTTAPRSTFRSRSSRTSRVVGRRRARRRSLSHVLGAANALLRQEDHPADGGRLRRGAHHQVEQGRQDVQRVGRLRGHVHLRHHRQVRMQPSVRLEARRWLAKLQSLVPSPASITVRTQNCSTRARRRSRCSSSSTTRPRSSIYRSTCRCSSSVASIDCVNHNVVRHHRSLLSAAAGAVARRHHASLSRRNLRFYQTENIDSQTQSRIKSMSRSSSVRFARTKASTRRNGSLNSARTKRSSTRNEPCSRPLTLLYL